MSLQVHALDRRQFLGVLGAAAGAAPALAADGPGLARWRDRIGLQMYTVRDRYPSDYPGTLKAIAAIGYRAVQPTGSYAGHGPDAVKRMLDENRLVAAATHVSPPDGAQFETTLDGYAKIGHRYTTIRMAAPRAPGAAAPESQPLTREAVQRMAARLNEAGRVSARHGVKVMYHNHAEEFQTLADAPLRVYDVLIAETDPALVALELDIGWAVAGGADPLKLFAQAPGRFEVWHVKDIADLASLKGIEPIRRGRATRVVPMGQGEIDYRPIFAAADQAGMKHFYIEQDSAPASGDSMAAAAESYRYLAGLLA
jgi:sugar phosphate isomerase/epimerase